MTRPIKIPFSQWKDKSRKFIGMDVHISMDGKTGKVTVKPIKSNF